MGRVERITEDQVSRLVRFVLARIPDTASVEGEEARRTAAALHLTAYRRIAAVRHHRDLTPDRTAGTELSSTASWNLLVSFALVWRDHPDFPADAAVETSAFGTEAPLSPAA